MGVVITGFTDPFRVALLGEVTRSLSEHALGPLLMNAEDPERLSELLRILLSYKISGVIMTSGSPPSARMRANWRAAPSGAWSNAWKNLPGRAA